MSATQQLLVVVALSVFVASCGDNKASSPSAPSPPSVAVLPANPVPPANPNTLVVFSDTHGFSTTDLLDDQQRIVQLTNGGDLIWTPDGTHLHGYQVNSHAAPPAYFISGKICSDGCEFSVRFGTRDGQRRAYLTVDYGHSNPGTLVDVEVVNGALVVTQTSLFPPGTPTLSGVITEMTRTGPTPVDGAYVGSGVPGGWQSAITDQNGYYKIFGLIDGISELAIIKSGYQSESRQIDLAGDTRFDIQLVRR